MRDILRVAGAPVSQVTFGLTVMYCTIHLMQYPNYAVEESLSPTLFFRSNSCSCESELAQK